MIWMLLSSVASAHITMDAPEPRGTDQKIGPCGGAADVRSTEVSVFRPGETITVSWHETIDHPSHYRISFDADGTDDFADPTTPTDFYTNDAVLEDEIEDEDDGRLSMQVTLPQVECERCTLQLIQVMLDKPPFEADTNDIYYQCADLVLSSEASGCGCATGSTGAPWVAALVWLVAASRRSAGRIRRSGSEGPGGADEPSTVPRPTEGR